MPTSTSAFGWPVPDNQTYMQNLGSELTSMAAAIDKTVSELKFMGQDPSAIAARVVALEGKARDMDTRLKKLENRIELVVPKRDLSVSFVANGDGWWWTAPITIPLPAGLFSSAPAIAVQAFAEGFLIDVQVTKQPTKDSFEIRIVKKNANALTKVAIMYTAKENKV